MDQKTRTARGRAFLELHRKGGGFVMPNAWDPGSAILLASEGFKAIGTTSAGIAFSLGRPDYNVRDASLSVGREEMIEVVRKIAAAVVRAQQNKGKGGPTAAKIGHAVRHRLYLVCFHCLRG